VPILIIHVKRRNAEHRGSNALRRPRWLSSAGIICRSHSCKGASVNRERVSLDSANEKPSFITPNIAKEAGESLGYCRCWVSCIYHFSTDPSILVGLCVMYASYSSLSVALFFLTILRFRVRFANLSPPHHTLFS
jgi:hypothetical protein